MANKRTPGVIEISEEAYKQNGVYRPWRDIKPIEKPLAPESVKVASQWTAVNR